MLLACRATKDCTGTMRSAMYPKNLALSFKPTYEWYTPSKRALRRESAATREHVRQGGLLIRPITKSGYDQWRSDILAILGAEAAEEGKSTGS